MGHSYSKDLAEKIRLQVENHFLRDPLTADCSVEESIDLLFRFLDFKPSLNDISDAGNEMMLQLRGKRKSQTGNELTSS